jgi:hypothetical protein
MISRNYAQIAAMFAMMGGMGNMYSHDRGNDLRPEDIDVKQPTPPTPKGMKWFEIDGYRVQAVTKKSAINKIKKLKENE